MFYKLNCVVPYKTVLITKTVRDVQQDLNNEKRKTQMKKIS